MFIHHRLHSGTDLICYHQNCPYFGVVHIYVITEGEGVDPMMTSDDEGEGGGRSLDDVIKNKNIISWGFLQKSIVFAKIACRFMTV